MFKQILISLLVLIVAAAGYVYFVPGSADVVHNLGINVPFPTAYGGSGPGNGHAGAGGPGGRAGAFGQRLTPTVITAAVTTSTINDRLSAIGQGTADQSVTVTSQAAGTLLKVDVKPGDHVSAGQTIAELDSDAEQIAYDKAQLASKDAADALARTKTLAKTNAATGVQLQAAQLAADNADLELRNAKLDLDKRAITTPIDGTVGLFQVTAGNAVANQTVITTVDDTSSILINYWIPERYAPVVKVGMPVTAQAVALPGQSFDGTVGAVDSRIDPTSRTLEVQARIPNVAGAIKPGMSFDVAMAFPGSTYPAVDPLAIQWGSDGSYVWLLTADSKVKKDKVAIIQRNSDGVLVEGDLKPGTQVVTQGVLQISDGVTVRRLDSAGNAMSDAAPTPAAGNKATGKGGEAASATLPASAVHAVAMAS